ncbi:geranylgeranyl diphosphate synthase type II [Sphingobacterium allocomposti]|uniref:Geranylgeranyl diphosphate synthase type II n=1 Tax=Sphingobacterium allocomposti TaxID=415956 RepID=A0A5S5DBA2_9SPHI|nr:polyprenyl synthetase family protein [Sphingobacterium composti Yoo et al. 2007 non Ten et al. 2007]TYP92965.1 geranylgeranyl diphosphate synthase type II [Sphingobacterium composti Yoo et al. 2007 non Ten et al. 2007]
MFQELAYAKVFQEYLEARNLPHSPSNLYDPIRYIMSLSGKRIRPLLVLMGAELFREDAVTSALPASVAIEYFHNFSLIHDDIMDKAPLRRGRPTVHQQWDDSVAILSGDALLVKAYEELAKCPPDKIPALLQIFNKTALEVCEGQQYDMDFEKRWEVSETEYIDMIRLKTSVLLGGALQMGAIIADADREAQSLIYEFGVNLGIAFQLQDDILDVYGDPETFGKQVGGDILANKKTILYIKLHELILGDDRRKLEHLLADDGEIKPQKVEKMKALYAKYDIQALAIYQKEKFTTIAYDKLKAIRLEEERKQSLFSLADALMNRVQ